MNNRHVCVAKLPCCTTISRLFVGIHMFLIRTIQLHMWLQLPVFHVGKKHQEKKSSLATHPDRISLAMLVFLFWSSTIFSSTVSLHINLQHTVLKKCNWKFPMQDGWWWIGSTIQRIITSIFVQKWPFHCPNSINPTWHPCWLICLYLICKCTPISSTLHFVYIYILLSYNPLKLHWDMLKYWLILNWLKYNPPKSIYM